MELMEGTRRGFDYSLKGKKVEERTLFVLIVKYVWKIRQFCEYVPTEYIYLGLKLSNKNFAFRRILFIFEEMK